MFFKKIFHEKRNKFFLSLDLKSNSFSYLVKTIIVRLYFSNSFHVNAARIPPTEGARINSHNCRKAVSPANMAGAILRAGLTEVPVMGIQTI